MDAPGQTRFWIDGAYVEYADPGQSLESYSVASNSTMALPARRKYASQYLWGKNGCQASPVPMSYGGTKLHRVATCETLGEKRRMLDRFHRRKNGVKAAIAAGSYTFILLIISIIILIALLDGKDSVALWPLLFIAFPFSLIGHGLFTLLSFDNIPDEQRWIIPVINWAFLLLAGLTQAWLLWLILRGPKSKQ